MMNRFLDFFRRPTRRLRTDTNPTEPAAEFSPVQLEGSTVTGESGEVSDQSGQLGARDTASEGWSNPYSTVPRKRIRKRTGSEGQGASKEKPETRSPLQPGRLDLVRSISADNVDKIAKEETEERPSWFERLRRSFSSSTTRQKYLQSRKESSDKKPIDTAMSAETTTEPAQEAVTDPDTLLPFNMLDTGSPVSPLPPIVAPISTTEEEEEVYPSLSSTTTPPRSFLVKVDSDSDFMIQRSLQSRPENQDIQRSISVDGLDDLEKEPVTDQEEKTGWFWRFRRTKIKRHERMPARVEVHPRILRSTSPSEAGSSQQELVDTGTPTPPPVSLRKRSSTTAEVQPISYSTVPEQRGKLLFKSDSDNCLQLKRAISEQPRSTQRILEVSVGRSNLHRMRSVSIEVLDDIPHVRKTEPPDEEMKPTPFSTASRHTRRLVKSGSDRNLLLQRAISEQPGSKLETAQRVDLLRSVSTNALDEVEDKRQRDDDEARVRFFATVRSRRPRRSSLPEGETTLRKISSSSSPLYKPRNVDAFTDLLLSGVEVNTLDEITGEAPIHAIVRKKRKDRVELLLSLLTHSDADVNLKTRKGMTALHFAIEEGNMLCVKALIAFGADVNQRGYNEFTPLDIAIDSGKVPAIEGILMELGAKGSAQLLGRRIHHKTNERVNDFMERRENQGWFEELQLNVNEKLGLSMSITDFNEAIAMTLQQQEMRQYSKTLQRKSNPRVMAMRLDGGCRMLFLDGGGIKGLIQIEVLLQIERATGKKITDLFDWIVGTSTGAIVALGLVHAGKSLHELRQMYYLMKTRIFARARMGFAYNTDALEEILKCLFGEKMRMSDVQHPMVLVAAVHKETTNPQLHFFNNCFGDEYSKQLVWKVARYTSAAPMFFKECDNYVDGGVLANNPCEFGLTAIHNHYRQMEKKLHINLVVSVGTGKYPAEKMGKIDAQELLVFGKWFTHRPDAMMKRAQNLISLLSNALVESEMVAKNCRSRCEEQGIPFYRFSPQLDEVVAAGETDNEKLFNIILKTRMQMSEQGLDELTAAYRIVVEAEKRFGESSAELVENTKSDDEQSERPMFNKGLETSI